MFRKRPYFLKKKEWYVKTELAGRETYRLTEEGWRDQKAVQSYLEYYGIKREDIFQYTSDYDRERNFKNWGAAKIREKMKEKGAENAEIEEAVNLFVNIEKYMDGDDEP